MDSDENVDPTTALGGGSIVIPTSSSIKQPIPNLGLSNVMRGAVSSLAKTLANELAHAGRAVDRREDRNVVARAHAPVGTEKPLERAHRLGRVSHDRPDVGTGRVHVLCRAEGQVVGVHVVAGLTGTLESFERAHQFVRANELGLLNVLDNCPLLANPTQSDVDGDGIGDACDDEINLIRPGYNYGWRANYPQTPLPCDDDETATFQTGTVGCSGGGRRGDAVRRGGGGAKSRRHGLDCAGILLAQQLVDGAPAGRDRGRLVLLLDPPPPVGSEPETTRNSISASDSRWSMKSISSDGWTRGPRASSGVSEMYRVPSGNAPRASSIETYRRMSRTLLQALRQQRGDQVFLADGVAQTHAGHPVHLRKRAQRDHVVVAIAHRVRVAGISLRVLEIRFVQNDQHVRRDPLHKEVEFGGGEDRSGRVVRVRQNHRPGLGRDRVQQRLQRRRNRRQAGGSRVGHRRENHRAKN